MNPSKFETPLPTTVGARKAHRFLWIAAGAALAWFLGAEIINYAWYASHESTLSKNQLPETGDAVLQRLKTFVSESGGQSKEQGIGDAAMEMLKCSYGRTLIWSANDGSQMAMTAIRWSDRSIVGGLESMHNPGNCLGAAGWTVGKKTELGIKDYCGASCEVTQWEVTQGGQRMLAYSAVFRRFAGAVSKPTTAFWNNKRLASVLSGRRDAPVLILLTYLPVTEFGNPASGSVRFDRAMRAVFCPQETGTSLP